MMKRKIFFLLLSCFLLLITSSRPAGAEITVPEKEQILYSVEKPSETLALEYKMTANRLYVVVKPSEQLTIKSLTLRDKTSKNDYKALQVDEKGHHFQLEASTTDTTVEIEVIIETETGQQLTFTAQPIKLEPQVTSSSLTSSSSSSDLGISNSSSDLTQPSTDTTQPASDISQKSQTIEAASSNSDANVHTIYRLYHPNLQVHLYTKDSNEYQVLARRGWRQEGQAWQFSENQGKLVYRLYHPQLKVHLYTQDKNEYTVLAQRGWSQEGVAFRSFGHVPIYRLYHKNLKRHLYTRDANEYQSLSKYGWTQEGIAFYGLGNPTSSIQTTTDRTGTLTFTKQTTDTVQINLSNVHSPKSIQSVMLAVWSDEKGQDDITWYRAEAQPDGTYSVTVSADKHRFSTGTYQAHLYYQENNEQLIAVTKGTFSLQLPTPQGRLNIDNINQQAGTFDVIVSDIQSRLPIRTASIAVWTEQGGQDDIHWYNATKLSDGRYKVTVKAKNHKQEAGLYQIHLYYTLNNQKSYGISTSNYTLSLQPAQITNQDVGKNTQAITIKQVDSHFSSIQVAVWTDKNGQDDKVVYNATKQADGTYQFNLPLKKHSFETGVYHLQALGKLDNDSYPIANHTIDIQALAPLDDTVVNVVSNQKQLGQLGLAIKEVDNSKKIRQIRAVAWSDNDRTNLYWYQVAPTGTLTNIKIDVRYHYYQSATYFLHVYIDYTDGTSKGVNLGKYYLNSPVKKPVAEVLGRAFSLVGISQGSPQHLQLVADYNSISPLPVGYQVKTTDDWCDIFVTVLYQRAGMSHLIGRECGVERHIQIFKSLGIWIEDGRITPKAGDIITFNWDQNTQENDGFADHIGIVERVENGYIYTIEGNSNRSVARRAYPIGHGNIRGFARPRY
ncbi:TPA: GBS Bsp-like repeat-containing protein [Streptococcus suis]